MADVIILGRGPAGISSALYTSRAGLRTMVIGQDDGALMKAHKIENYYGFPEPISGERLIQNGIDQAKRLGTELVRDEVLGVTLEEEFVLTGRSGTYRAPAVILATGSSRSAPHMEGLSRLEGHGVSYCAVCDGFFYRGRDVAVLGGGEYALHEANTLAPIAKSVTILTNGNEPEVTVPSGMKVITEKISALKGETALQSVVFSDGTSFPVNGLFVAVGVAGSSDLARKLGAQVKGNSIEVDMEMRSNIPGLFAAGDCTGGLLQISKAVYEGAMAATGVIKMLRRSKSKE